MKKFRFTLEGVSKVRGHEVKSRQAALAESARQLSAAQGSQARLVEALRASLNRPAHPGEVPVADLVDLERERQSLRTALDRSDERIRGWLRKVETERDELIEARRKAEAVEKLRERRYLEFVREVIREEQATTDEVAGRTAQKKAA